MREHMTAAAIKKTHPAFVMDRQGKDFVTFSGLLDAAHRAGLSSIVTTLLQAPNEANGNTTIVHATVTMKDGDIFTGIGDANVGNVGKQIAPHAIRMAETRAKARALRDALNIGGAALEELGGEDDAQETVPQLAPRADVRTQQRNPEEAYRAPASTPEPTPMVKPETLQQIKHWWALLGRPGDPPSVATQSSADETLANLRGFAAREKASEAQWKRYMDAAAKLTAAGVPEKDVFMPESMTVAQYEQIIVKMNGIRSSLAGPR